VLITEEGATELGRWLSETEAPEPYLHSTLFAKVVLALLLDHDPGTFLDAQRARHMQRMRELTELKRTGEVVDQLLADNALFHLEADLRWIDLTAARLDRLRSAVRRLNRLTPGRAADGRRMETVLLHHYGIDLPCFVAFLLVDTRWARRASRLLPTVPICSRPRRALLLDAPIWRANPTGLRGSAGRRACRREPAVGGICRRGSSSRPADGPAILVEAWSARVTRLRAGQHDVGGRGPGHHSPQLRALPTRRSTG
jgi:hypothetical protein